ncbi:signal transduction histidine kinase, nitrogen specific, NtrB [Desulfonatronospira thiodismutans ASO3-1]|uniref:histidine kinase n=1 Tax=Desulfonatronospira thiodismutans ASO3-1 TaxID=555779 RepID=D6STV7_9BACT|nr:ATP-binding protein [Desulfonatronospira thiodismutans]EFI34123.1 signal transduction histidine kinase, nitrogen specific, NtrB [Desulfonatronospira thiodismutans ASO3-1]
MDIRLDRKEVSTALVFGLIFVLLGAGLFFLTWQNLRQQQEQVREHMALSAQSIGRGIEANLYRGAMRGMGGRRWADEQDFIPAAEDLLKELMQDGDVVFLGLYGPEGEEFYASRDILPVDFRPGPEMLEKASREVWNAELVLDGQQVFVQGFPSRRMGHMRGRMLQENDPGNGYGSLFIALDMSGHLEAYSGYKRTISVQAVFTFTALFIIGLLAWGYVRKKEQGRQFVRLSSFHSRLLDNMPDGLISVNSRMEITAANPAAQELLDQNRNIVGSSLSEVLPLEIDLEQRSGWHELEMGNRSIEVLILPIGEEEDFLVLLRDRTRMRELESSLEHSRRLAAVGRFAAGLAHEIRNPLSSLKGFAQYFQQKFSGEEPASEYARTMVSEADRLNRVINDLMYLARPRSLQRVELNLADLFQEVRTLLEMDLRSGSVQLILEPGEVEVKADRDLIKQAVLNLVLNSLQASRQGGEISLRATREKDRVRIEVQDRGCGMDAATREKALEPFFSAREKGSGLGLAIVHRIVQDHGGEIEIDSMEGKGTRVALLLPDTSDG